jgi:hypothetical protein
MKFYLLALSFFLLPAMALASDFSFSAHPLLDEVPVTFMTDGRGGFYGVTKNGYSYTQTVIENSAGIKLHKFTLVDLSFYISDVGVIEATSDTKALYIYFARV